MKYRMRKSEILIVGIIAISFTIGFYFYPKMPDRMASHWNMRGEVDGSLSKFWGLFLMPLISLGMFALFVIIPAIDPLRENIEKFRKYFDVFIVLVILFLLYLYLLTIFWNQGARFEMITSLIPAMSVLLYYAGVLIMHTQRNWSIGIRTPWTLSSEHVWEKTHAIGGKLFKIAGIVALLGLLFPSLGIYFIIIPALIATLYTFIYSYWAYRQELHESQ